jgi:hypothetical protein
MTLDEGGGPSGLGQRVFLRVRDGGRTRGADAQSDRVTQPGERLIPVEHLNGAEPREELGVLRAVSARDHDQLDAIPRGLRAQCRQDLPDGVQAGTGDRDDRQLESVRRDAPIVSAALSAGY